MSNHWTERNPFQDWTQEKQCFDKYAINEKNEICSPNSPWAKKFCAIGWLQKQQITPTTIELFNEWCLTNYEQGSITALNDVERWQPRDFEFAWERFVLELEGKLRKETD